MPVQALLWCLDGTQGQGKRVAGLRERLEGAEVAELLDDEDWRRSGEPEDRDDPPGANQYVAMMETVLGVDLSLLTMPGATSRPPRFAPPSSSAAIQAIEAGNAFFELDPSSWKVQRWIGHELTSAGDVSRVT